MDFLRSYIRQHRFVLISYLLFFVIFTLTFLLYRLPLVAVFYPFLLCFLIGAGFVIYDYSRALKHHKRLRKIEKLSADILAGEPLANGILEADYQSLIQLLLEEQKELKSAANHRYNDMVDYYTVWAHQIKTPIASMRLHLQNEDSSLSRRLSSDLFRIEQYVEMVLMFLRLDSETTDYVFRKQDLDAIIRPSIRKFSGEFIEQKITLIYEPIHFDVVTDEKWLSFVIEQVLSNALKYTKQGHIAIRLEESDCLCIEDTGIGILPEDLSRIFEKGYTGYNGRENRRASGIGLYLCKRICENLGISISAESVPDKGTTIRIDLKQKNIEYE